MGTATAAILLTDAQIASMCVSVEVVVVSLKKKAPFMLKKIREGSSRSVNEAQEENIPNPGEVKIKPPE